MRYTVVDKLTGELISFSNKADAEMELERRLMRHRLGYNIKRNHVSGCNAKCFTKGNIFYIAMKEEDCL